MKYKIRAISVVLGLLIVLLGVCGCKEQEVIELTFRITWDVTSGRGEAIANIVQDFNDSHKYIHVTVISGNEEESDIVASVQNKEADVYMLPYRALKDEQVVDNLVEVSDVFEDQWTHYYDSILSLTGSGDKRYGLPWLGHSMALIYNKQLTSEAKVDPQQWLTLDDMVTGCQRVVEVLSVTLDDPPSGTLFHPGMRCAGIS